MYFYENAELSIKKRSATLMGTDPISHFHFPVSEEEMAFYDAISVGRKAINENGELKELVRELVKIIKRDLAIDWMNNDIIKARIRANVKLLLLRKGYKAEESEKVLDLIYQQAFSLYRDFVPVMA